MTVPTLITDLSTTAASNSPSGSENVFPNLDDYMRATSAFIASIRDNSGNGWVSPYLASTALTAPGPIGGTTPGAGTFTTLTATTGNFSAGMTSTTGTFTSNLTVTSPVLMGYATGSGGTVTQATDKSTAVTLNKPVGRVTMNNAALASATRVSFTLSNSLIAAADVIYVSISGAFSGYDIQARVQAAGSATITVYNNSVGTLSEALVLNFVVIKGATA